MANLMGFRRVSSMPKTNPYPMPRTNPYPYTYQPLLQEVRSKGGIYKLDAHDSKRAHGIAYVIYQTIERLGYSDVQVSVRDTAVFVKKEEKDDTQN